MSKEKKHLQNNLGLWGWLGGGRYGLERYAFFLHRLTGLGLLAYFIMHIFVTGTRIGGAEKWTQAMHFYETPLFKFGEFLIFIAFAFHAINGIRLGLAELGMILIKPARPLLPYRSSVIRQRPWMIVVMIITAVIIIAGGLDFYVLK